MHRIWKKSVLFAVAGILLVTAGCHTPVLPPQKVSAFRDWPAGTSPDQVGERVAKNFAARKLDFQVNPRREYVIYPEVCGWYGSLTVAQLIQNESLEKKLIRKFDYLLESKTNRISSSAHVDYRVLGVVPFEIYMITRDPKYLKVGQELADNQWSRTTPDGITREARYWIDDMYMISAVQVQAYRATNDPKYIDRAAITMAAYLDRLQQTNGLFFHAPDSPQYWARGNGWVAAGMTEVLRSLPENHPKRARIMEGYQKMMASLLKYQSEEGLWRQLLDKPESWLETSGTGMFAFAMVTGVKMGWLDEQTYGPAARKAWLGLVSRLDRKSNVKDVCVGTNKAYQEVGSDPAAQVKFYLDRSRKTGDLHGQSPILWTASALLR